MTISSERYQAVLRTEKFLLSLCDPKATPRVPSVVRQQARSLLKHYPGEFYMDIVSEKVAEHFGKDFKI